MKELWSETLEVIKGHVSPQAFNVWFKPLCPGSELPDGRVEILTQNQLSADYVRSHYGALLESTLSDQAGRTVRVLFRLDPQAEEEVQPSWALQPRPSPKALARATARARTTTEAKK